MKKINISSRTQFPPVKLYRGDIEAIYAYMRRISNDIKIQDEEYEYENLNELFDTKVEINSMRLDIEDPYFSLQFYPDQSWLIFDDKTNLISSSAKEIKHIINNHKNWAVWIIKKCLFDISLILLLPLIIFVIYLSNYITGFYFLVFGIIILYYMDKLRFKKYSRIILTSDTSIYFLRRNSDSITVVVVIVALSTIINFIISSWK